jgi:hypothetical protein
VVLALIREKRKRETAVTASPPHIGSFEPIRSARRPARGAATTTSTVVGRKRTPVSIGE